jgi:hypothetical protein
MIHYLITGFTLEEVFFKVSLLKKIVNKYKKNYKSILIPPILESIK